MELGAEKLATRFVESGVKQVSHVEGSKLAEMAAKGLLKIEKPEVNSVLKTADQVANHKAGKSVTTISLTTEKVRLGKTVKAPPPVKHTTPLTKIRPKAGNLDGAVQKVIKGLPKAEANGRVPTIALHSDDFARISLTNNTAPNTVVWTEEMGKQLMTAPETLDPNLLSKPIHVFPSTARAGGFKWTTTTIENLQKKLTSPEYFHPDKTLIYETSIDRAKLDQSSHAAWKEFWNKPGNTYFEPSMASSAVELPEVELSFGNTKTKRHLTVIEPKQDVNSLQGIDALRTFIKQQKVAASDIGKAAGLDQPKGIVVVGPPGTGKSAVAEAIGADLDRPVVRISPSDYKGNLVGESEKNFRNIIESIKGKDVVLWIDEVEKAFPAPKGGMGGSTSDGGVLNEFLTFLNENESVYTVMTSNDPTAVAPELIRKGRMDDVFYVGLPEESARAAIFKTHLEKRGWSMSDEHLKLLAEKTQGFSGAEIEQAVKEGIRNAFFENVQKGLPTEQFQPPVVQDFIDAVSKSKPVSVTNKAQVDKIQSWSREVQARDAAGVKTDAILPGKGGGLTELLPVRVDGNDLGGFEHYKKWIQQRSALMTPEARAKGLPMPKGVMLVGVQGSGKSLGAEVTASMLNRPLIKLSMAKIAEGNVAENLRKAIVEIQQAKHCVVLIDEFEKAMQLRRAAPEAAAEFLTFLNEQDQAFIAATANDLSQMPPEYMRKGRFDEIFFVDLPNQSERESIFKALVDKVDQEHIELYSTDLETLATAAKGYTGAEIKAALESARITAFADGGRNATVQDVLGALQETTPASRGMADKVQQMRQNAMEIGRPVGHGYVN